MEIKNYPNYLIYENGNIYSKNRNRFLKPTPNSKGYLQVNLGKNGSVRTRLIHRLVAEYYIPNPDNKPQVDHIDRNRQNNSINNLRWVNPSENQINKPIRGKIPYRHISTKKMNGTYYQIKIKRNYKQIYQKYFKKNNWTIIQVLTYRDTIVYPKFKITPLF